MSRDLEDGANSVEFLIAGNVRCASISSTLEGVEVVLEESIEKVHKTKV